MKSPEGRAVRLANRRSGRGGNPPGFPAKLLAVVLTVLAAGSLSSLAVADAPSSAFNIPGQARTRTCVGMKTERAPLRFADGTPTGWYVSAKDTSRQGGNHEACPQNTMELDLHEQLTTASGLKLCFHPGGGPSHYRDWVTNGQYGHVALDDLVSPPEPIGSMNGKPAPLGEVRYFIAPTRLPRDMWYKPNVFNGRSGSTYYTYGNPGFDKTGGRGDWTYLNWSWVQNGGPKYPQNKCGGGGMVRALLPRDATFCACRVAPIIGYSYGPDNAVNGRVTACYGQAFAGPRASGDAIYGWTVHSYQKRGDVIVPCVRRSGVGVVPGIDPPPNRDRAERMSWNLVHPMKPDARRREAWLKQYDREPMPLDRMELITGLSRMDDAETVGILLRICAQETEPRVREQAILIVGFLASAPDRIREICSAMAENYRRADPRERRRTLEAVSNFPAPEAARFVTSRWQSAGTEAERLAAADAVLKLAPRVAVEETVVRAARKLRAATPRWPGSAE